MADIAASPTFSDTEPSGISGWLLLPAFAMIISPLRIAYEFHQSFFPLLKPAVWLSLLSTRSTVYNPPLAVLLSWEIVANVILFICTIWLAIMFFKKHKSVPKFYIAWLLASCALQITDLFFGSLIPMVAAQQNGSAIGDLMKSVVATAIWVPYFLKSKRVKNTFVNESRIKASESSWP